MTEVDKVLTKEEKILNLENKISRNREEIDRLLHTDWKSIEVLHIRITMLSDLNKQYIEEIKQLNGKKKRL